MMYEIKDLDKAVRSCDGCTKCCEGHLSGKSYGIKFLHGNPCHFVSLGKGCSIYEDRPYKPCQTFKCAWLMDETREFPEWMKPSLSNVIIVPRHIDDILYMDVVEAGCKIDSSILNWLFMYTINKKHNLRVQVGSGYHNYGSKEFHDAWQRKQDQEENFLRNRQANADNAS